MGIPKNVCLCLRFPFLYPRNRWTGRHYNNWKLHDKHCKLYQQYHIFESDKDAIDKYSNLSKKELKKSSVYYLKKLTDSGWCEYWTNWWSKPYVKVIDFVNN